MSNRSRSHLRIALALFGLVLLVVFMLRIGPGAVLAQLRQVGVGAIWLLLPYAAGTAIGAFPWVWLLPENERPSLSATLKSRFAASSANMILPFFGLAGEPSRLLWLRGDARVPGVAALIVDRVIYNLGSHLFLLSGGLVALAAWHVPRALGASAVAIALLAVVVTLGIAWAVVHWGIGQRIETLFRKFRPSAESPRQFAAHVDDAVRQMFAPPRGKLWFGVLVHAAGRVAMGVEVLIALLLLDVSARPADVIILATVPIATAFVASSIPSQLGVQEGAQALVCQALGLGAAVGFTLVLLQRLRQLAFAPLAPLFIGTARPEEPATTRVTAVPLREE